MPSGGAHRAARVWPVLVLGAALSVLARAEPLHSRDDCSIEEQSDKRTWTISNNWLEYELGIGDDATLRARRLQRRGSELNWVDTPPADIALTLDGETIELGHNDAVTLRESRVEDHGTGLRLVLSFASGSNTIEKSLACYPDVAVLEQWLTILTENAEGRTEVAAPTLFAWSSPSSNVEWLRGLDERPDGREPFTIQHQELFPDQRIELRAFERSTETDWPWAVLRTESDAMIAGVLWSGAWAMDVEGRESGTRIRAGLPEFSTSVSSARPFETPHVFFGVTGGGAAQVGQAMRRYVDVGLREGRPLWPLVTYNTWFAHGIEIDAAVVRREAEVASQLGVEVFEVDAGWYPRPAGTSTFDFTAGLGVYHADESRFPGGLKPSGDHLRARGMKFGVWVEPERVDLATVGRAGGPEEAWLARASGGTRPTSGDRDARGAMICLAHPEARAWVFNQVAALIAREGVDYLKWDNNAWLNCDRDGHGHGPRDGNHAHVRGLYDVLSELRRQFPSLLIENVSGGGHRIDLEMLRHTDVGWMDDRSAPSTRVRRNLEGLSRVLPLAYLLSYTMAHETEALHEAVDPAWLVRSRMPGVLGFTYRGAQLNEADVRVLGDQVALYKRLRGILADAHGVLLTPQVTESGEQSWDAVQAVSPGTGASVVFAFRNAEGAAPFRARLAGLDPTTLYSVESVDRGFIGRFPGELLAETGLLIEASAGPSRALTWIVSPAEP